MSEYSNVKKPFSPSCENDILIVFRQFIDMIGPLSPQNAVTDFRRAPQSVTPERRHLAGENRDIVLPYGKTGASPQTKNRAGSHSRRAFPHDSCFQSRSALRPAVFSDRIVLSGEYRPENVPFHRMQAFWTTEQTVPPFQAGHFCATNETSGRHDALFATVFPPPFRHHRFSCFKANPDRQADHYNGDGIR